MNVPSLTARLALLALVLPAVCAAQRLYTWVDEHGVTHYGDRVPPEYADQDRLVLNRQGIVVERQQVGITEEQRAEQERLAAEAEARRAQEQHDRFLLQSYTRVDEIEATRDRRLAQMDAQIASTAKLAEDVRTRLVQLRRNASRYKPYSTDENAREIPSQLAANISQAETSLADYEARLDAYGVDREAILESFARDIGRFKELKGL